MTTEPTQVCGDTTAKALPVSPKRRWWRIAVVVVVIMVVVAAFNMWRESQQLEKLNRRMPGVIDSPRNQVTSEQGSKEAERVTHPETQCSFVLPAGWQPFERPGKSLAYLGPVRQDSTPNILINAVPLTGTVRDYAGAELEAMQTTWPGLELLEEGPCQTQSGLQGYKVIFKRKAQDGPRILQQRYYFFPWPQGRCLIFLTTSSELYGDELNALFDECARSIENK